MATSNASTDITPPLNLVVVEYGGGGKTAQPGAGPSLADAIAGFGGELLVNAADPMRVYEYVLPVPTRLIVSQWKAIDAIHAFVGSDIYNTEIRATIGPDYGVALYNPASDWDPTLPGIWAEPGAPAEVSPGPVYHTTIYDLTAPEKLPFAAVAMSVLDNYRRWGGFPIINRRPIEILEGRWSEKRNLLMTRWPCQEAFEAWFLDEPYQQNVKPRRLEAGRFSVMMFPAAA